MPLMTVLASLSLLAIVPTPADMRGPFPIMSIPYHEDGSVDHKVLANELRFVADSGCRGVMWGQSNDSIDLLTTDEKLQCFETVASAAEDLDITLAMGANGTNTTEMLYFAREIEKIADRHPRSRIALVSRPPDDVRTESGLETAWDELGRVVRRPVVFQTHCSDKTPIPSPEMMIRLSKRHEAVFGYIKEESANWSANDRMRIEVAAKPVIKTVLAGWGGWQWLLQLRHCGCEGLVTERCAYAPLLAHIWNIYESGERGLPLTQAFAMYRLMIDQRNFPSGLRGYSLYFLMRAGVFKNMLSRQYLEVRVTEGGTFGVGRDWKLEDVKLNDVQRNELDLLFDDMSNFCRKGKRK